MVQISKDNEVIKCIFVDSFAVKHFLNGPVVKDVCLVYKMKFGYQQYS